MGIGEPLDNFDAVMQFLELVNSPDGLNIGMRHISLSTCGLVDKIRLLAEREAAADALGVASLAGQRVEKQNHADQQTLERRRAAGGVPGDYYEKSRDVACRLNTR